MSSLSTKVSLYLEANGKTRNELGPSDASNVILQKDSDNPKAYIRKWDVEGVTKPTDEQLNALESEADAEENLNKVLSNRQAEYPTIAELTVALYDTDDKSAVEAKRAAVKLKYPKP